MYILYGVASALDWEKDREGGGTGRKMSASVRMVAQILILGSAPNWSPFPDWNIKSSLQAPVLNT